MSKMSELSFAADELKRCGDILIGVSETLASLTNASENDDAASITKDFPAPKPVTLEQVRAVLAEKSNDGYTAEIRALLEKHGAPKLSEINPDRYAALLADAEALV